MESFQDDANLTSHEFLLAHRVLRLKGNACSFKISHALVTLEPRYCKVKDWSPKFFFVFVHGREFPVGQVNCREFPIRTDWGKILKDKAVHPTVTPYEANHLAIVREWV